MRAYIDLSTPPSKLWTGQITARRMREDYWSFHRTHKFWLSTNHLPQINGTDEGIWRRIKLIPFRVDLRTVTKPIPEAIEFFDIRGNSMIGTGSYLVEVAINSESIPVSGAQATIKSGSNVIRSAITNASGKAAFALDSGDYILSVVATGFDFLIDSEFSVSGHTVVERELSQIPMDPSSTPNTCRVRIHATRGAIGALARVTITTSNVGRKADRAFLNTSFDGLTDADGLLFVDLAWSSTLGVGQYRFRLIDPDSGKLLHDRTCFVPSQSTANYEDLT